MKEMKEIKKDFWHVNHKGSAFIVGIGVLYCILIISQCIVINLKSYHNMQNVDQDYEIIVTKVLQKVKKDFYEQKLEEFSIIYNHYVADGIYDENTCEVMISGNQYVRLVITYDDVYLCIENVEYYYE